MTTKAECESIGYTWVKPYRKKSGERVKGYCRNPFDKEEEFRYIRGKYKGTPEEAYASLREEFGKEYGVPNTKEIDGDIFYPTDFHADWEKTGEAPEYDYEKGMKMARNGEMPGFGTGILSTDNHSWHYMEGHIEKKGKKYIAYGEADTQRY